MSRVRILRVTLLLLVAVSASMLLVMPGKASATAGINQELSFEGKIVTAAGINIPDGTYNMQFQIYTGCTNDTGTGCTSVWSENWLVGTAPVTFSSGTFQVNLGQNTSLSSIPAADWDTYPLYLSLELGNTATPLGTCVGTANFATNCGGDGVMSPYILLTSTPYSFDSSELGGIASSGYIQTAPSSAQQIQPTSNTTGLTVLQNSNATPTADIFDVQTVNNSDAIQVTGPSLNNADVTINSIGASSTLDLGTSAYDKTVSIGAVGATADTTALALATSTGAAQTITIGGTGLTSGSNTGTTVNIEGGQTNVNVADAGATIQTFTNSDVALQVENSSGQSVLTVNTATATVQANATFNSTGVITADDTEIIQDSGANNNALTVDNSVGIPILVAGSNNFIINGDFIGGSTTGWSTIGTGSSIALNTNPTYNDAGTDSLAITVGATANAGAQTTNNFNEPLPAGTYELSFYAKAATAFTTLEATLGTGTCTLNSTTVSTTAFAEYYCTVTTTGTTTSVAIESSGTTALTFYVDGVQLISGTNLVSNPGFETGTTGWSAGTASTIAWNQTRDNVYFGQGSLEVTTGTTADEGAKDSTYISTLGATTYTLSFFAEGTTAFTTLEASLGSGTCTLNSTTVSTTGFREYTCTVTTTGAPTIQIGSSAATAVTFYIDDVQLVTGSTLVPYNVGQIQLRGIIDNPVIFQSTSNSAEALQIANASGTNLFVADTLDSSIAIGTTGATTALLAVGGTTGNFQVSSAGSTTIASGQSYTGAGAVTLSSGGATALTLTGGAASTFSTTAGAITLQSGSGDIVLNAGGAATANIQIGTGDGGAGSADPDLLTLDDLSTGSAAPTEVNGAMYYNAGTNDYECGVAGAWETCSGLLYSNTAVGTAVTTCTTACDTIATAPIPANYCQAGKEIHIIARGTYSDTTAAPTLSFGFYYGTNATTKTSDKLIGAASPASSETAVSTTQPWSIDYTIICFSTTSMEGAGTVTVETSTTTTTTNLMNQFLPTTTTGLTTSAASNLYLFPAIGTSNAANSAVDDQYIVTGS